MPSHVHPEQQARERIDAMLAESGWMVQSLEELNLHASLGVAVREVRSKGGPADYILFADGKALGVVEAKKEGETLSQVAGQSARYSKAGNWIPRRWADPLPFTYETTGIETNFRDQRDPDSRSRPVFTFHRPETLRDLVTQPDTLRSRLKSLPTLPDSALRECQIRAISHLETSLSENRPRALVQMATGSGKTFTAVSLAYRLIKFGGAKRILFLVDRGNLGRQTLNEFQQFTTPDDGRKFTDLYNAQMLGPGGLDPVCKVTVSTIQRLYSQLTNRELDEEIDERSGYELDGTGRPNREPLPVSYNPAIPIETFDFVIIDECHRSIYNLWKQVLDYFDAFLIGLTATPSKATLGFFNRNLVTEYPHVQAVADGVNVGYDIYRIKTRVSDEGTKLEAGFDYQKRDRLTREKRWAIQDEEQTVTRNQLDRSVVVVDQIRKVVETFRDKLFVDLFPGRSGNWVPKTLVFAKDDSHAEDIVGVIREVFAKGNEFCQKITYKAGAKPEEIIKAFRTAPEFRIAVTVDMVATGTDIKPLECLLFLRDVRSQLYFEQMKGRGTRTIDPTDLSAVTPDAGNKTRFVLVDAVGVTESDKTDSRPLERKPTVPFEKLLQQIALGDRDADTLTSLANRLARLDRAISDEDREELRASGGISLKELASNLLQATDPDKLAELGGQSSPAAAAFVESATKPIAANPGFRQLLEKKRRDQEVTIDHISADEIIEAGYDEEKARGLIQNWKKFLADNRDEITALQILYNRHHGKRHLVYEELKALVEAVGSPPYHIAPAEVWAAYEHLEKRPLSRDPVKILTNLISLVRHTVDPEHQPLEPFPAIVDQRFEAWLDQRARKAAEEPGPYKGKPPASTESFTPEQLRWLQAIKNTIALNGAFPTDDREQYLEAWQSVDSDEAVPLAVAKRAFGGDPRDLIEELNRTLIA